MEGRGFVLRVVSRFIDYVYKVWCVESVGAVLMFLFFK